MRLSSFGAGAPASEDELSHTAARALPATKFRKGFTFLDEPMPLFGAGKVLKTELRKPFWKD